MEGYFWKTLLVLGALSASGRGEPSHKPLTYQKALELGVANYNNKAGEDLLYQLLEAVPQPEWDPNSEGTQELKFTIKETVCPVEEGRALEECDFKEDGVVRECTGNYFLGEKPPLAFVTCDAVEGIEEEEEVEEEKKDEDEEEDRSRRRKLRRRPSRKVIIIVIKF
ncbi:cathelicidin-related peptide Oh-Cath-like [Crotalus tigris]|uniref:cathelicidin-related peptide Oh-Cath-like n=1 Tax=Crotalus tigris TaxID=88082 RepID=UPI00192F81ED|nr:cathelicidin-related peptide Oh-Cath-like [Crotalus tigris]